MIKKLQSLKNPSSDNFKTIFKLKQKIYKKSKTSGRSKTGQITVFNKGGAKKRNNYLISSYNFYRGIAERFEYNPNKNSFLLRVYDIDKRKHFYTSLTHNLLP